MPHEAAHILPSATPYHNLVVSATEAQSLFAYKNTLVEQLVWNIKYKKSRIATNIAAHALYQHILNHEQYTLCPTILIIPIPITRRRRYERGYNQCELILDEMSDIYESDSKQTKDTMTILFENKLLVRTKHRVRQTFKNRHERIKQAKHIFEIDQNKLEKTDYNVHLIIIDDVITTGSTMREAIDTCRKAGFTHVSGLSLAH